jgi:hypothetical protein
MTDSRTTFSARQSPSETAGNALTFDERWALWQQKGARHDARVKRKVRLIAAIALMIGVIWALVSLWSRDSEGALRALGASVDALGSQHTLVQQDQAQSKKKLAPDRWPLAPDHPDRGGDKGRKASRTILQRARSMPQNRRPCSRVSRKRAS